MSHIACIIFQAMAIYKNLNEDGSRAPLEDNIEITDSRQEDFFPHSISGASKQDSSDFYSEAEVMKPSKEK